MAINNVELAKILLAKNFTAAQAKVMLAIAYAESGLNPNAEGDSPNSLNSLGHTANADMAAYWNCPVSGQTDNNSAGASIGLFQIFLPANHDLVINKSGINISLLNIGLKYPVPANEIDACKLITWLKVPANNVIAAKAVFDSQGYGAWSTYNGGQYLNYMTTATTAVDTAVAQTTTPTPTPTTPPKSTIPTSPIPGTSYTIGTSIIVLGIAAGVFGISYYVIKRNRGEI